MFFFFQAEDGIRDLTVTGVQTCALPICDPQRRTARQAQRVGRFDADVDAPAPPDDEAGRVALTRTASATTTAPPGARRRNTTRFHPAGKVHVPSRCQLPPPVR